MTIVPVIFDVRPAYLRRPSAPLSLLLTPAGPSVMLDLICRAVSVVSSETPYILTDFDPAPEYAARVRAVRPRIEQIFSRIQLQRLLDRCELSDWILLVDPSCYPENGLDLRNLFRTWHKERTARHLLVLDQLQRGSREYVQVDSGGCVPRVQRYYDGVTWVQTQAVQASLIPVAALLEIVPSTEIDLAALRRALAVKAFPSRDVSISSGLFDLRNEHDLLELCEQQLRATDRHTLPADFQILAPGILAGPGCRVHPTARLYGPVVLQSNTSVEADAAVIGPALVGADSHIQCGALLAHCLVAEGTTVQPHIKVHHRLLYGMVNGDSPASDSPLRTHEADTIRAEQPMTVAGPAVEYSGSHRRDWYPRFKRIVEGVVAALGLVALTPLLLVVVILIKLTSRGPILFCHEREGRDGRPFACYKFRTMVANAHSLQRELYRQNQVDGPQFKLARDPRLSPIGRWLRTTNIDELPQLWNVVRGDMSLIGPRPSPFRENQICIPWRQARLSVRPGVTGLWQICHQGRAGGDFHQWIYYDTLYVRYMSPWLDLKILLATMLAVGGRRNVPLCWIIPDRTLREDHERLHFARVQPLEPLFPTSCQPNPPTAAGV